MAEQATTTQAGGDPNMHVTINAVVNYIFGGLSIFLGLFLALGAAFLGDVVARYYPPAGAFMAGGGFLLFFALLVFAIPQIMAAIGLSKRSESGRVMALVVAAFHILYGLTLLGGNMLALLNLGYGGYAFWSLLKPDVAALFRDDLQATA